MTEIDALKQIIALLETSADIRAKYAGDISIFKQKLETAKTHRYRLGVLGVTSSGKSTMLNALLGEKLLPEAGRPSSSQLVSCCHGSERKGVVFFENKPSRILYGKDLNDSVIGMYGDEQLSHGNREGVKQIELVSPKLPFQDHLLLVDSPGLDAYGLEKHEALTMETLLPTLDFCLFVTTCKSNSDAKMEMVLNSVAKHDIPVLIVQNMLDAVRPSPDGKKTQAQVAEEHKRRAERIIEASQIKDKATAQVVQISAKQAEEALLKNDSHLRRVSNYQLLVDRIKAAFNQVYPRVESRRIAAVQRSADRFVDEISKSILKSQNNVSVHQSFEYENLPGEMDREFQRVNQNVDRAINNLEDYVNQVCNRSRGSFNGKCVDDIKNAVDCCSDTLLKTLQQYNVWLKNTCDKLGVQSSEVTSVRLDFAPVGTLSIKTKTEPVRKKKDGFFNWVKRGAGSLFDADWGYEYGKRTTTDVSASIEASKNYLNMSVNTFIRIYDRWEKAAENVRSNLLGKINQERCAYEMRRKVALSQESAKNILEKLKAFSASLAPHTHVVSSPLKHEHTDFVEERLESMSISGTAMDICRAGRKILNSVSMALMETILKYSEKKITVLGWDVDSLSHFSKRYFGDVPEDLGRNYACAISNGAHIYLLHGQKIKFGGEAKSVFVLLNMGQSGAALTQLSMSGIMQSIRKEDRIFFVFQDLDEIITGQSVTEALEEIELFSKRLGVYRKPFLWVNSENPVYCLLLVEIQLIYQESLLQTDETTILYELKKRFPYLMTPKSEKIVGEIMRHYSTTKPRGKAVPKDSSIILKVDAETQKIMRQLEDDISADMVSRDELKDILNRLSNIERTLAALKAKG